MIEKEISPRLKHCENPTILHPLLAYNRAILMSMCFCEKQSNHNNWKGNCHKIIKFYNYLLKLLFYNQIY
jgi:hypothetical protein